MRIKNDESINEIYRIMGAEYQLPLASNLGKNTEIIIMRATVVFAKNGYVGASLRDIAQAIGIKSASLYNHFSCKEDLWKAVLERADELYRLYIDHLDLALQEAKDMDDFLDILFSAPISMENDFTCFAFSLILSEQLYDDDAWRIFSNSFARYAVDALRRNLQACIDNGFADSFDVEATARIIGHLCLLAVQIQTQKLMNRPLPYDHIKMVIGLKEFLRDVLQRKAR
ncbi:hypothetical protein FACS189492_1540 [Clostridia bacterium]|nr:hypothetical protein FACS189492_1540 [Clostridia bacterium]